MRADRDARRGLQWPVADCNSLHLGPSPGSGSDRLFPDSEGERRRSSIRAVRGRAPPPGAGAGNALSCPSHCALGHGARAAPGRGAALAGRSEHGACSPSEARPSAGPHRRLSRFLSPFPCRARAALHPSRWASFAPVPGPAARAAQRLTSGTCPDQGLGRHRRARRRQMQTTAGGSVV